ncbi:aspartate aminotransferase family protein [Anaerolineales bacterium]
MDSQTVIQREKEYLVQNYGRPDFVIERGEGMVLYDADGKAYQDWVAGIAVNALGYGDEGIAATFIDTLKKGVLHTSNLYHTEAHTLLAQQLVEKSFADRVLFCNSGAEANEGAIKLARKYQYDQGKTGKTQIVSFSGAFHGRLMGSLALTPKEKYQGPFRPLMPDVVVGTFNDIETAKQIINERTAAVFVEPIQGEGGIHLASAEFLRALRKLCDEYDACLVFDEIQCGVGRTGKLWAHEWAGIYPDMMTIAKLLEAGLPIGAILCKQKVADCIHPGDHGSTFAGGPMVTGVANYVLGRISEPAFLAHVEEVGDYLKERLEEIHSPVIVAIRGQGLMCAIELNIEAQKVVAAGFEAGLLLVNAGVNVIRLVPPLIVEKADVDLLIERLTGLLEQVNG